MPQSACSLLHPNEPSGPCKLCKECKPRYWHISQALPHHKELEKKLKGEGIGETDCICQACQKKFAKGDDVKDSFAKKGLKRSLKECSVSGCRNVKRLHSTDLASSSQSSLIGLNVDLGSEPNSLAGKSICHKHYCKLYRENTSRKCSICQSWQDNLVNCHNIDAAKEFASVVLQNKEVCHLPEYKLCRNCYGAVYRYSKGQLFHNAQRSSVKYFISLLAPFQNLGENDSPESLSFAHAVNFVGKELIHDRAVLLRVAYDVYLQKYDDMVTSVSPNNACTKMSVHSFLSSLKVALGECMITSVVPGKPRLGTMLRRYGSDIATTLHEILYDQRPSVTTEEETSPKVKSNKVSSLSCLADLMNRNISSTAKKVINNDKLHSISLDSFDLESEVKKINPILWNFVVACTLNASENRQHILSNRFDWNVHYLDDTHLSSQVSRSKFLKRLFVACGLLYATNENCYTHLHMAVADIIDRFTGSSTKCFELLSKFGVTVSKSTFLRFQTSVSEREMIYKPLTLSNSFCIASVDNIDRSSTYAAVRADQGQRGFHGTSVQAVEPLPISLASGSSQRNLVQKSTEVGRVNTKTNVSSEEVSSYHKVPKPLTSKDVSNSPFQPNGHKQQLKIDDFSLTDEERCALSTFEQKVFFYMLVKHIAHKKCPGVILPSLKTSVADNTTMMEQSNIHFTSILAEQADKPDTLLSVLDLLHAKHQVGKLVDHLVVVGDAKTYAVLVDLKRLYGDELSWVIPYLGEWHLLKNSQPLIMKIYLDAGLKELLAMFHKGATLKAVSNASGFKKCHQFLLQSWEAYYRHFLSCYESFTQSSGDVNLLSSFEQDAEISLREHGSNFFQHCCTGQLQEYRKPLFDSYLSFASSQCSKDKNFRFWYGFASRDMLFYTGLYMAIRSRDFHLRSSAIRSLAPIFHALDRPNYLKLVPLHIATLKLCPPHIVDKLQQGAFAVSMTGQHSQCVALDEAHEMGINKEVKMAMNATDVEGLSRLVHYLPYRSRVSRNVLKLIKDDDTCKADNFDFANLKEVETNVRMYLSKLSESKLFKLSSESTLLTHLFSGKVATQGTTDDLLNFYPSGELDFQSYVKCFILGDVSVKQTRHKRNLQTFTEKKVSMHKKQQELKDHKLQIACLRKQIAWSKSNEVPVEGFSQFLPLPLAISDSSGIPFKGNKAVSSTFLQTRYSHAFLGQVDVISNDNTCVILEGMFMINATRPLDCHKTFGDFALSLYKQWVDKAVRIFNPLEIHILFDHPGRHGIMPKDIERCRRDNKSSSSDQSHVYTEITATTLKPNNWLKFIRNRVNKRLLVAFLSNQLLCIARDAHYCPEVLITAGGFDGHDSDKAFQFTGGTIHENPVFRSNHEEGDSRVWFHAVKTNCNIIIIYSPDRDTFNIGLPLMQSHLAQKQVYVQLRRQYSNDLFLYMNELVECLLKEFDFQILGKELISLVPSFIQMLFISSGCDYVSFFKGHTKLSFFKVFFRYAKFITGGINPGLLNQARPTETDEGLLSFYRLIGSVYFVAHAGAFVEESPEQLFCNIKSSGMSALEHHIAFITKIRACHFHRISDESQWMPSSDALRFHWLRSCWAYQLWSQACSNHVVMPDCSCYGWELHDGTISPIWDTPENLASIAENTNFLKSGCKCKTGCGTQRCKCQKRDILCGPSCTCMNCSNKTMAISNLGEMTLDEESSSESSDSSSESDIEELDTDDENKFF